MAIASHHFQPPQPSAQSTHLRGWPINFDHYLETAVARDFLAIMATTCRTANGQVIALALALLVMPERKATARSVQPAEQLDRATRHQHAGGARVARI